MSRIYAVGERVKVLNVHPPGHRRTPYYVRGKEGVIERDCGVFHNPEELGHGFDGEPRKRLYRVRFRQKEVWGSYQGSDADTVDVDIYEHWLVPAKGKAS